MESQVDVESISSRADDLVLSKSRQSQVDVESTS